MNRSRGLAAKLQGAGAVLLIGGYLQNVLITLQAMTIKKDEHGMWHVVLDPAHASRLWSVLVFLFVFLGLAVFAGGFLFKRMRPRPKDPGRSRLTTRDMLLSYGWVGLVFFGIMFLYYNTGIAHLIPSSIRQSPAAASLGSVSLQLVAMVTVPLYYRKSLHEIGIRRPVFNWKMLGYIAMFFVMMYAMSLLTNILGGFVGVNTDSYREQNISKELHDAIRGGWLFSFLPMISTGVIAPIGEELLFRGILQSTLTANYGKLIGVLGSAFLFALIHADIVLFLPIFFIGILFAVLHRITGSIWAPIWLHMLNNLYASIMDLF